MISLLDESFPDLGDQSTLRAIASHQSPKRANYGAQLQHAVKEASRYSSRKPSPLQAVSLALLAKERRELTS